MTAAFIARRVVRLGRDHPGPLVALAAASAALALVGSGAVMVARAGRATVPSLQAEVHVVAFLGDESPAADGQLLVETLRRLPGVARVRLVRPEEATARLGAAARSLGQAPAAVADPGFMPASLEVAMTPGPDLPARAAALGAKLRGVPGIAEVDAMTDGLARLASWVALGRGLGLVAVALGLVAALAGLALAVSRARAAWRDGLALLVMLGETVWGTRLPALLLSAAATLVGVALGLLVSAMAAPLALARLAVAAGLPALPSPSLAGGEIALALLVAVLLGWAAGRLAAPVPGRADA